MKIWQWLVLSACIIGFVCLSAGSALSESLTFDELVHREEGLNHWLNHTFTIDKYNPPLARELETVPVILGSDKLTNSDIQAVIYFPSRLVTIFLAVLLIIALFLTARKYFGTNTGLLAVFLLALQPIFLAHSHYLTLDTGTALSIFVAYVFLAEVMISPRALNFIFLGISTGLALASRVTTLPFMLLSVVGVYLINNIKISRLKTFGWSVTVTLLIAFLTLWSAYFFRFDILPNRLSEKYMSQAVIENNRTLISFLNFSRYQKMPLGIYFDQVKRNFLRSQQPARTFFLGDYYSRSYWYFMPVNLFLKTPLPFWILLTWALWGLVKSKKKRTDIYIFLLPAIIILALISFGNATPWVRYALPVYPFLALVIAGSIKEFKGFYKYFALLVLLTWFAFSTLSYNPHFISYANELAGPGDKIYQILDDSNLDWGQSIPDLVKYINKVNPKFVSFSYFGRDNADPYGLVSNFPYGDYRFEYICRFHEIPRPGGTADRIIAISVTNWYDCGFSKLKDFSENKIKEIIGNSILIFQ